MRSALVAVLAGSGLMSCSGLQEMYGEEYVLYDSRRNANSGQGASAPANTLAPASAEGTDFARILLLEQVRGELERAILDGFDTDGALAQKRRTVDEELKGRVAAAGDQLAAWRAARVAELKQFATTK